MKEFKKIKWYALCGVLFCACFFVFHIFCKEQPETYEYESPMYLGETVLSYNALADENSLTEDLFESEGSDKASLYLRHYFDISLMEDTLQEAYDKLFGLSKEDSDTGADADITVPAQTDIFDLLYDAIVVCEKDSLLSFYTKEKTEQRFLFYGITDVEFETLNEEEVTDYGVLACALDLGMVDAQGALQILNDELSVTEQENIIMHIANLCGLGRNYIGYSNETTIYCDIQKMYAQYTDSLSNEATISEGEQLSNIMEQFATQYELDAFYKKNNAYSSRFLPTLTIAFECLSETEITQIIGLMHCENIVGKIQLEPKTDCLSETLLFDLVVEFETQKDMLSFCESLETNEVPVSYLSKATTLLAKTDRFHAISLVCVSNEEETYYFYCLPKDASKWTKQLNAFLTESNIQAVVTAETYICDKQLPDALTDADFDEE